MPDSSASCVAAFPHDYLPDASYHIHSTVYTLPSSKLVSLVLSKVKLRHVCDPDHD